MKRVMYTPLTHLGIPQDVHLSHTWVYLRVVTTVTHLGIPRVVTTVTHPGIP